MLNRNCAGRLVALLIAGLFVPASVAGQGSGVHKESKGPMQVWVPHERLQELREADVQALGYGFVLAPVMINVIVMLSLAVLYNSVFPWRRYPAHLSHQYLALRKRHEQREVAERVSQADIEAAMKDMDGFFDVTAEELQDLLNLAVHHAEKRTEQQQRLGFLGRALRSRRQTRRRRLLASVQSGPENTSAANASKHDESRVA